MWMVSASVDPRILRSRKAMLAAAHDLLLQEGPSAVTHQRVAQRAKVGRATVYRHWPRLDLLVMDAMASVELPFFRDPVTPVRPWLRGHLRRFADELAMPQVAVVAVAMMLGSGTDAQSELRDRFSAIAGERLRAAFAMAADAGELELALDPSDAQALLVGPLLQRTVMQSGTVSEELLDRVIDSIGNWRPAADQGGKR
jgi:AcrR family transcriptional regulator